MAQYEKKRHGDRHFAKGKICTREDITKCFHDGQIIGIGGQASCNFPWRLIDCLCESGAKHLTIYSIDAGDPGVGVGKIISNGQVDRMVTTHIGTNPEASQLFLDGKLQIELCPMGSFIERIRCAGAGLGGVLTKTGIGTVVEEGKRTVEVQGEKYLLEEVLRPEISLTRARYADITGNLRYRGTGTASHPLIAMAGKLSIVECDLLVDVDEIARDDVRVPGVYVDMVLPQEELEW